MSGVLGDIKLWAGGDRLPAGWVRCDGRALARSEYSILFAKIGYRYGNEGVNKFRLPNLQGFTVAGEGKHRDDGSSLVAGEQRGELEVRLGINNLPVHSHTQQVAKASGNDRLLKHNLLSAHTPLYAKPVDASLRDLSELTVAKAGGSDSHSNLMPYTVLDFIICIDGSFYRNVHQQVATSETTDRFLDVDGIIGTVELLAGTYARKGFLPCDGRKLLVRESRFNALFSLIGNRFGGDGFNTFQLPDMRKRIPVGADGIQFKLGEQGGEQEVTLTPEQLPAHSHIARVQASSPDSVASDSVIANLAGVREFARPTERPSALVMLNSAGITPVGGGKPHQNQQSYVEVCFAICFDGEYPA